MAGAATKLRPSATVDNIVFIVFSRQITGAIVRLLAVKTLGWIKKARYKAGL